MKHYFWERPNSKCCLPQLVLVEGAPAHQGFFLFQSCLYESNLVILRRCSSSRHLCNLTAMFWFWFSGWEPQKHPVS